MPLRNDGGGGADAAGFEQVFGLASPPPPPPVARPTLGAAPIVSSNPSAGQGVALDAAGKLTVIVQFLGVVTADPSSPHTGQFWYRADTSQLCVQHDASTTKRVTLA